MEKNYIELVGITVVTRSISSVNKECRGGSGWVLATGGGRGREEATSWEEGN